MHSSRRCLHFWHQELTHERAWLCGPACTERYLHACPTLTLSFFGLPAMPLGFFAFLPPASPVPLATAAPALFAAPLTVPLAGVPACCLGWREADARGSTVACALGAAAAAAVDGASSVRGWHSSAWCSTQVARLLCTRHGQACLSGPMHAPMHKQPAINWGFSCNTPT